MDKVASLAGIAVAESNVGWMYKVASLAGIAVGEPNVGWMDKVASLGVIFFQKLGEGSKWGLNISIFFHLSRVFFF